MKSTLRGSAKKKEIALIGEGEYSINGAYAWRTEFVLRLWNRMVNCSVRVRSSVSETRYNSSTYHPRVPKHQIDRPTMGGFLPWIYRAMAGDHRGAYTLEILENWISTPSQR